MPITRANQLMPFRKIIGVKYKNSTKHTLCGKHQIFLLVQHDSTSKLPVGFKWLRKGSGSSPFHCHYQLF